MGGGNGRGHALVHGCSRLLVVPVFYLVIDDGIARMKRLLRRGRSESSVAAPASGPR